MAPRRWEWSASDCIPIIPASAAGTSRSPFWSAPSGPSSARWCITARRWRWRRSLTALGIWSAFGPFWSLPPNFLAGAAAAAGIALVNSVGNLGGFVGPAIFGFVKQSTGGFAGALWALAAVLMAGGIAVLFVRGRSERRGFEVMLNSQVL